MPHSEIIGLKSMIPVLKSLTDEDLRKHGVGIQLSKNMYVIFARKISYIIVC
jgi:hypothetical protein